VQHLDHTRTAIFNPDGSVQEIFLADLSGAVFYDTADRVWKVRPQGEIFPLYLEDPFADDYDIEAELSICHIRYSSRIQRLKLSQTSH
jgi:hypothetical protein